MAGTLVLSLSGCLGPGGNNEPKESLVPPAPSISSPAEIKPEIKPTEVSPTEVKPSPEVTPPEIKPPEVTPPGVPAPAPTPQDKCNVTPDEFQIVKKTVYSGISPTDISVIDRIPGAELKFGDAPALAKKYGLTLAEVDLQSQIKQIDEADSIEKVVAVMNAQGLKSNLSIEITGPTADIPLEDFKNGARSLSKTLYLSPVELIEASGVKKISFADLKGVSGLFRRDIIFMNPKKFYLKNSRIFIHELSHGLEDQACGLDADYASHDNQYALWNPPDFYYGRDKKEDVWTIAVTDYGTDSLVEDKSTMSEHLFPFYDKRLITGTGEIPPSEVIEGKSTLLLAKWQRLIASKHPSADFPGYLTSISDMEKYDLGLGGARPGTPFPPPPTPTP